MVKYTYTITCSLYKNPSMQETFEIDVFSTDVETIAIQYAFLLKELAYHYNAMDYNPIAIQMISN